MVERTSAIGNAYQTPQTPKKGGKINNSGIKKNPCFVKLNNKAGVALPMAWK